MKKYLLVLVLFLSTNIFAQTTVNRKIGSRIDIYSSNTWQGQDSAVFAYNAFGHESERATLKGQGSNWNNFLRYTSNYDANGNLTARTTQTWNNGSWRFTNKYSYSYNGNNLQTEVLYQVWNTTASAWSNAGRILYSYNANQDRTKTESFAWNGSNWIPTSRKDYVYNTSNVLLRTEYFTYQNNNWQRIERFNYQFAFGFVSLLERMVDDGLSGWRPVSRTLTTVNGSANPPRINSISYQFRDTTNSNWVDSFRISNTYLNNNLTEILRDRYDTTTALWTDISKNDMVYNTSNQLVTDLFSDNSASSTSLSLVSKKEYSYNANNLNDSITYFNYIGSSNWIESGREHFIYNSNDSLVYNLQEDYVNSSFVPTKQYFYYYGNIAVGLDDIIRLDSDAVVYPNPASSILNLKMSTTLNGAYELTIYSMTGQRIRSQISNKPTGELQVDIRSLPGGNYILQLRQSGTNNAAHYKFTKE